MRLFLRTMRGKIALCWFTLIFFYVLTLGSGPIPPSEGLIAALFHLTLILALVSPELLYLIKSPGRNWRRWGEEGNPLTAANPKKFQASGDVMSSYNQRFRVATFFTEGRRRCTTTLRDCNCRDYGENCTVPCKHMCQLAGKLGALPAGNRTTIEDSIASPSEK